jgi:hypothetical protein
VVCSLTYADDDHDIDHLGDAFEALAGNPSPKDRPNPVIPPLEEFNLDQVLTPREAPYPAAGERSADYDQPISTARPPHTTARPPPDRNDQPSVSEQFREGWKRLAVRSRDGQAVVRAAWSDTAQFAERKGYLSNIDHDGDLQLAQPGAAAMDRRPVQDSGRSICPARSCTQSDSPRLVVELIKEAAGAGTRADLIGPRARSPGVRRKPAHRRSPAARDGLTPIRPG